MVQGNATVVIDLGNSETRGLVMFGKDSSTGKYHERKFTVSNRFDRVNEDFRPSSDYSEESSTVFQINSVVDDRDFRGVFCNGEVQEREFNIAPLRPTALEKKYTAQTTALSFEVSMLYATRALMQITRTTDYKQIDVNWDVFILLPPGDLAEGKDKLSNIIESVKRVECAYPDVDFDIKLNKTVVLPEGYCAYIAVIFDKGKIIRPAYQSLISKTTMILDIGAGTTDMLIVRDQRIISTTMTTIERGGNNVTQLVKKELRSRYGLKLNETDLNRGIVTGKVKDGAREIDITDIINDAKDKVAASLITDVKAFFEETEFPIRSIEELLVCGGGSMSSDDDEDANTAIKALSESVVEQMQTYSPYIELVEIPTTMTNVEMEDGTCKRVEKRISPRMLNIIGASILAEGMQ